VDVAFVAVLPDDYAAAQHLLESQSLRDFTLLSNIPITTYHASGTPTLIEVDRLGVVEHVWRGALPQSRQSEVVNALYHGS
jgi:hypothetical protein